MRRFALFATFIAVSSFGYSGTALAEDAPPAEDQTASAEAVGGLQFGTEPKPGPTTPGSKAKINPDGTAVPPENAPDWIQQIVYDGNEIIGAPYVYGGAHGVTAEMSRSEQIEKYLSGVDCSSAISAPLLLTGKLSRTMDSSDFMSWGDKGRGANLTVYTNPGHAYLALESIGIRLDTSGGGQNYRRYRRGRLGWQPLKSKGGNSGYQARHLTTDDPVAVPARSR